MSFDFEKSVNSCMEDIANGVSENDIYEMHLVSVVKEAKKRIAKREDIGIDLRQYALGTLIAKLVKEGYCINFYNNTIDSTLSNCMIITLRKDKIYTKAAISYEELDNIVDKDTCEIETLVALYEQFMREEKENGGK